MESLENTSHPFLVRIWLEETALESRPASWRGHITHVPSGKRLYLTSLDDIKAFIFPYLDDMGIQPDLSERVRRWLKAVRLG
jgi:hypothetical protein